MVHESLEVSQTVGLELVQRSLVLSVQQVLENITMYSVQYILQYNVQYSVQYRVQCRAGLCKI